MEVFLDSLNNMKNPKKTFYDDLETLRKKYPMVYFEAWTPDDFEVDSKVDWNDSRHVETVDELNHTFDANFGTNWDRVRDARECS